MFRQPSVLFVSQLLFFALTAATLNNILQSVPDQAAPLSSQLAARFLAKYFGSHISARNAKHISLVTPLNSDRRLIYDSHISHLLHSNDAEFSYRFMDTSTWHTNFIGASVVLFFVADYKQWQ